MDKINIQTCIAKLKTIIWVIDWLTRLPICSMVIIGGRSGTSICVMHCRFCVTQIFGRAPHSNTWTILLSWKKFSILRRQSHNHGLPSMRTVLSIVRWDNSCTDKQSRSLSRKSRVSSRGNVRKTSGSIYTKPHLKEKRKRVLDVVRACVRACVRKYTCSHFQNIQNKLEELDSRGSAIPQEIHPIKQDF